MLQNTQVRGMANSKSKTNGFENVAIGKTNRHCLIRNLFLLKYQAKVD